MTNLEMIKEKAQILLSLPIIQNETFPFLVSHPFFSSIYSAYDNELINIIENEEKVKENVSNQIDKITDCNQFLIFIQKPYLPVFFKMINHYLSKEDFANFLREIWIMVEFPNADKNVSLNDWLKYFQKADKKFLMNESDYKKFLALPDVITVYRGVKATGKTKALSWTTELETAHWFASRFKDDGYVCKAEIKKEDVFAYFNDREEHEVIVNYKKLKNIVILTKEEEKLDVV